jgi:hypothetical protein
VLLRALVTTFAPRGPLLVGIDETVERRRGAKIAAKGIYRDGVRSSHGYFVKASGLRWLCVMLLVTVPWAGRVWALPFLTALAPSERYATTRGRRHKALLDWALLETHWPDLLQVVLSIKAGTVSSALLLRKLGTYSRRNRLYLAFGELGRVVRTAFSLEYLSNARLREWPPKAPRPPRPRPTAAFAMTRSGAARAGVVKRPGRQPLR